MPSNPQVPTPMPGPMILVELHRPLFPREIPERAFRERHSRLLMIEFVIRRVQRLSKIIDPSIRMELLPRMATGVFVAGLQNEHERVETGNDLFQGSVGDLVGVF